MRTGHGDRMTQARPTASFDPRPLTEPAPRAAVREFNRRLRAQGALSASVSSIVGIVIAGIVVVVFLTVAVQFAVVFTRGVASGTGAAGLLFGPIPLLFVIVPVLVVLVLVKQGGLGASSRRYRLDRFARANGMTYLPAIDDPGLPGMIFDKGHDRRASDLVRGERPRFVEFGNYRYKTGSGKQETTHQWGYVAVRLDVPLPNIVLDATSNNGLFGSNLPESYGRVQRLSLEGDFDRYFRLYCPPGYERDALYLFTPDVMARFIDNAAALDVEIVDDWLFLYAQRDLSTLDPATWAWLFSVVGAILDKLTQWGRWRDDQLTADAAGQPLPFAPPAGVLRPPGVASAGRRLRGGIPVRAFIVGAAVLAGIWYFFIR